jgi:hypothetical protein
MNKSCPICTEWKYKSLVTICPICPRPVSQTKQETRTGHVFVKLLSPIGHASV